MRWLKKFAERFSKAQSFEDYGDAVSSPARASAEKEIFPSKPPSIRKEWLMDKIPHEDIASGAIYERRVTPSTQSLDGSPTNENKNPRYWMLPYSATDGEDWIRFQSNMQPEDEVWTFSSTAAGAQSPWNWSGVCLVRQGEIVHFVGDELHLHYRR